jgi:thioredoxin 1
MHEIKSVNDFNEILYKHKYVVVDFFAKWCGPCKNIAPLFDELSKKYTDVYFCKVDIDVADEVAELCEITSMPTFLFYKNKENVDELLGADANELSHKVNSLIH